MEESSPAKDSESPVSHSENNDQSHSVSPERPVVDTEIITSPASNENHVENRLLNVEENVDIEERPHRETLPDGFLETDETLFQRHIPLNGLDSHENESTFSCKYPGCTFTSSDVELYLKHEDTHVGGESMVCDVSNSHLATYANMRRHRLLHLNVHPLECQICTKRFLRKDHFMEHLLKHSKKRSYRCPFCSKSFALRPHLKTHLSTEHTTVVIDKTCRLCDFTASSPNGAKIHFAMCHLKQTFDASDTEERSQENIGSSQTHANLTENGAIDLAAVSQNFSFIQAAHYSPYAPPSDSSSVPGPSDLSRTSKIHLGPTAPGPNPLLPQALEHNVMSVPDEDNRHACVSALAGSTTMISPVACQDRTCCRPTPISELPVRDRVYVKPEPPELTVDDSQNSSVQPTSTMDLSTSDVVETTCVINEASVSSETPCRRKIHKHSSGDDSCSGSHASPPNRGRDLQNKSHASRTPHTCCKFRQCEDSNQRYKGFPKHSCTSHQPAEKRTRFSENDSERNAQNEHSDCEERKVFYNRATSTNAFTQSDLPVPSIIHHTSLHNEGSCTSESRPESSYYGRKSTIVIRDIESCTLTCPYCGIIFPDQTLYLLHRSLHSESSPWKCNLCGKSCKDKYDFNSHLISKGHY